MRPIVSPKTMGGEYQSNAIYVGIIISFVSIFIAVFALLLDWYHIEIDMDGDGDVVRLEVDDSLSEREQFIKDMNTGDSQYETLDNGELGSEYSGTENTKVMTKVFVLLSLIACSIATILGFIAMFAGRGPMVAATVVAIIAVLFSFLSAFMFMVLWNPYDDGSDDEPDEELCNDEVLEGSFFYMNYEAECNIDGTNVDTKMTAYAGVGYWMTVFHLVMMFISAIIFFRHSRNKNTNFIVF